MIYRLSKHHSQNVLHGHMTGGSGHDLSLARQMLVFILHKGKKDEDLLQVIIFFFRPVLIRMFPRGGSREYS